MRSYRDETDFQKEKIGRRHTRRIKTKNNTSFFSWLTLVNICKKQIRWLSPWSYSSWDALPLNTAFLSSEWHLWLTTPPRIEFHLASSTSLYVSGIEYVTASTPFCDGTALVGKDNFIQFYFSYVIFLIESKWNFPRWWRVAKGSARVRHKVSSRWLGWSTRTTRNFWPKQTSSLASIKVKFASTRSLAEQIKDL